MKITIRPFEARDKSAWHELWQGYLKYYKSELSDEITEITWQRLLDPDFGIYGLGAFDESGNMVGIVHFMFHPVTWSENERCYLEDLFISIDARGKGVGRALIDAVNQTAVSRGADQVYWLTEDFNHTAHKLYDKVATRTPFIKYAQYFRD